jgi:hypothetical protein
MENHREKKIRGYLYFWHGLAHLSAALHSFVRSACGSPQHQHEKLRQSGRDNLLALIRVGVWPE